MTPYTFGQKVAFELSRQKTAGGLGDLAQAAGRGLGGLFGGAKKAVPPAAPKVPTRPQINPNDLERMGDFIHNPAAAPKVPTVYAPAPGGPTASDLDQLSDAFKRPPAPAPSVNPARTPRPSPLQAKPTVAGLERLGAEIQ